ncbi:hypothetical protein GOBAR_DD00240 [Gossypium barbadense]|nr:hypothetical protein GOBAR_DD00240 [Gossypium barbadense]
MDLEVRDKGYEMWTFRRVHWEKLEADPNACPHRTDVRVRLSFPTATTRDHLKVEEGRQMMDLEVRDKDTKMWTFRLYTGKNEGHPKPVLSKGWVEFVKRNTKQRVGGA